MTDNCKIVVTKRMQEAGWQIASDLINADRFHSRWEGLEARKTGEFESFHSGKNMDLIKQYVNDKIDSVTAIYIAMQRESTIPNKML